MDRACAMLDTPIGHLWVVVSRDGLIAVSRSDLPPADADPDETACADAVTQLAAYFGGALRDFDLELDLAGVSAFDATVWSGARAIPFGETVSYGELAAIAGNPRAARAVGGAMARCPLTPVVPCHRVIRADGSIGGWGGETWVKRRLLDLEGGRRRVLREPPDVRIHTT